MPKQTKRKALSADTIDNSDDDGDFNPVASDPEKDEDEPVQKKAKTEQKSSKGADEGEFVVSLDGKKKLSVQKFKSMTLINIREFYIDKKDNTEKPGKKGIALSPEAWNAIKANVKAIDAAIAKLK
ncbi:hypothetical protein HDV00_011758 [Rhizophlyctis rosea]|nr:hypothetical protein HDV00_011758 [Rhizophlyctis rosea]